MTKKMICENRSIDCGDWCPHADTHDHNENCKGPGDYCTAKYCVEECDDAYQYGKNSALPSNSQCLEKSINRQTFKIDVDKLSDSLIDKTKEKMILSTLMKATYEKEEMECLKAISLSYSTIIDQIRKSLGNIETSEILSTIESLKNCDNCDVGRDAQCYPDGPCETRGCNYRDGWTGWRNPDAHPDDVTIIVMSKEEIEQLIKEELE